MLDMFIFHNNNLIYLTLTLILFLSFGLCLILNSWLLASSECLGLSSKIFSVFYEKSFLIALVIFVYFLFFKNEKKVNLKSFLNNIFAFLWYFLFKIYFKLFEALRRGRLRPQIYSF